MSRTAFYINLPEEENMKKSFSTETLLQELKTSKFVMDSIPMGYVPGLPILAILNGNLCIKVPYLKYQVTGVVDNTYVFPPKYTVTIGIPENINLGFEDLAVNKAFAQVRFGDPIGTFRHDAIKDLNKTAYKNMRHMLYAEYDKIVCHLTAGQPYTFEDEQHFKALLQTLLEPSLMPFYKALDQEFYNKYLKQ